MMPDFTYHERDDIVFPELFNKYPHRHLCEQCGVFDPNCRKTKCKLNKPPKLEVGKTFTFTMPNGMARRHVEPTHDVTGKLLVRPAWMSRESLAVWVEGSPVPMRELQLRRIIAINGIPFKQPKAKSTARRVWQVAGSKGNTYTVSEYQGVWDCTCPGQKYHGHCKHVEQTKQSVTV